MMDWLLAPVRLPRWVVWGALLTSPALWTRRFAAVVRRRLPGPKEGAE